MKPSDDLIVSSVEPTGVNRKKVWMQKRKNLFNKNNILLAYYVKSEDGTLVPYPYGTNNVYSLDVSNYTNIIISGGFNGDTYALYDNSSKFISGGTYTNGTAINVSGASIIKITIKTEKLNTTQIEEGTTATAYETYIEPTIYVKNNNDVYEEFISTPKAIWTNPSPSANFAGQTITLNDILSNYTYYEVIFYYDVNNGFQLTTGKISTSKPTILNLASNYLYRRVISALSGNTITFNDAQIFMTLGEGTTRNDYMIPYQILVYK